MSNLPSEQDAARFVWWFNKWRADGDPVTDWVIWIPDGRRKATIEEWREHIDRQMELEADEPANALVRTNGPLG